MSREIFQDTLRIPEKRETSVNETLTRSVEILLPDRESLQREMESRRIKLYLGIDATSPDLHIGHTVPLRKLRQFQDLGHEVVLLFGGFTSLIGDPTDKSAARKRLTFEEVKTNMTTYLEQAGRILDLSPDSSNPIAVMDNAEWLSRLTLAEVIDIQANFTVQQMLERDMFKKRMKEEKPIWLQEFSYPWMQGWDAVAMDVDLEVGGKDQLFNMLVGRTLVQRYKGHEKWVLGTKLIEDPSGKKMGKTEGELVNINDWSEVKYEGIMAWPDSATGIGFELVTSVPMEVVHQIQEEVVRISEGRGIIHPMELKETLAHCVVSELDGVEAANYAREEFDRVKRRKELPRRMREVVVESGTSLVAVLVNSGLAKDTDEARSKITQGAVYVDGTKTRKIFEWGLSGGIVSIGKRSIRNIRSVVTE